jgi:uncharacterized protein (TIGR03083 family)
MEPEANPSEFLAVPQNKAELVTWIKQARGELEETIAGLDDTDLTRSGPGGGWSVKDHLAHLTTWQKKLLSLLEGRPGYEGLGIDEELYLTQDLDAVNEQIFQRQRSRSLDEVKADFSDTFERLLETLEMLPEEDLYAPYDPQDPQETRKMIDGIMDNSYRHDLEHMAYIRAQTGNYGDEQTAGRV